MFKRILVAADGSNYSRQALRTGLEIARRFGAEVELMAVVAAGDFTAATPELISGTYEFGDVGTLGRQMLGQTMTGIDTAGVKFRTKITQGRAAEMILKELRRDFDLVVMGSRGHSPLGGMLIGSVTQKVMREAYCPVLVVKKP